MKGKQHAEISDNLVYDNVANDGAGIRFCFFWGALPRPMVFCNTIVNNHAAVTGGGIQVEDADPVFWRLTIDGNSAGTTGGGLYVFGNLGTGAVALSDCIVANSGGGGGISCNHDGWVTTKYCDVWNNTGGDYIGCIPDSTDLSCDPEYCEHVAVSYEIYETSGCVGSGEHGYDVGAHGVGCFHTPYVAFYDNFSDQDAADWTEEVAGAGSWLVLYGEYLGEAGPLVPGFVRSTVETLWVRNYA